MTFRNKPSDAPTSTTEVRAIRIPKSMGAVLETEARAREVSVNALITEILKKFVEFDRHTNKFEYISISREAFETIVGKLDDQDALKAGNDVGERIPKEITQFWFKALNLETFLSFLSNFSKYAKLVRYDVKVDGRTYAIALYHAMGMKWSMFLRGYFEKAVPAILGVPGRFEVSRDMVTLRFTLPESQSHSVPRF
jgi:hypothetical protein